MMDRLNTLIVSFAARMQREEGQTMAEYALVLAVVAIGVLVALGLLSGQIGTEFGKVQNALNK
jgi:Flp pilus assembly pilin Flp